MADGLSSGLFASADARSEAARVRCERAVSELRFGRPILFGTETGAQAVLALDAAAPDEVERFRRAGTAGMRLFLSAPRARALGLPGTGPVTLAAGDEDFAGLSRLAFAPLGRTEREGRPAPELAALCDLAGVALLLPAFLCRPADDAANLGVDLLALDAADVREALGTEASFAEVARTPVPLRDLPAAEFVVFRGGLAQRDQLAIVVGRPDLSKPVPVRIHSSCITGDLFGSLKCDCGDQLREGLQLIAQRGGGVLLYLDQEGRGTGLASKMRAYRLQHDGFDTIDADAELGFEADGRRYGAAVAMLRELGIGSVELLTNNPSKIAALQEAGIEVRGRTPVLGAVTAENQNYLVTKAVRAGHLLDWPAIAAKLG